MRESDITMSELKRLQDEAVEALRKNRLSEPPLLFFLNPLVDWFESLHIELVRAGSFPDARRAFNPVFIHLPAEGCHLTELAARANMTKQSMAELVDELVDKGYLARFPDPNDRRAKIIVRAEKGLQAHEATMLAFARIERELETRLGRESLQQLRSDLATACDSIAAPESEP
ncbi:MAG: MarR family transcriptional regulator [Salaquimonas sp.]|nr:MarR family transcriptional regulator [Salaquimonas sp.]